MRDLSEVAVTLLFALCGLAVTYWILEQWLIALVQQSFESVLVEVR